MILLEEIVKAREAIKGVTNETPFTYAPLLSHYCDTSIYLKKENLQLTGAYKLRGAYNKIASLTKEERMRGVIAASAGNHAQGVAYSAKKFAIPATIIMPEATPLLKVLSTKSLGAEVILHGENYDEAYAYALSYADDHQLTFIHPFADDKVIAGQGSVALEMLDQVDDIDTVVIPIGGGGLISGMSSALKALKPNIRIIGVVASGADAMLQSFKAKKAIDSVSVRTIADGIAVRDVNVKNLSYILELVDDIVSVDDEEIANAILFLLEKQKLVVEGGGAVGVAAIMHQKFDYDQNSKIATVLSGGNIDVSMLSIIIEKGLIKAYRKMKLIITLIDKPGALMDLTDILRELNANIMQIGYDRTSTSLSYGDANVTIALETKGDEHQESIRKRLLKEGYHFSEEMRG
ncbi:MAG: threonine ammonia-lyase [Epsilonproteobacteria bacterium]|nr:threonine ammonia-lyase [Campylobacterota bacterium]